MKTVQPQVQDTIVVDVGEHNCQNTKSIIVIFTT